MRIIVMSDSHGDYSVVKEIVANNRSADMFIHLGDGEREIMEIRKEYPDIDFRFVAGNCDRYPVAPKSDIVVTDCGVRMYITHGNNAFVNGGTELLRSIARDNNCTVALFGHTHCRYYEYQDGMYLFNPGSCRCPRDGKKASYGLMYVTEKGILTNFVEL